jgi:hypothetical protein
VAIVPAKELVSDPAGDVRFQNVLGGVRPRMRA